MCAFVVLGLFFNT